MVARLQPFGSKALAMFEAKSGIAATVSVASAQMVNSRPTKSVDLEALTKVDSIAATNLPSTLPPCTTGSKTRQTLSNSQDYFRPTAS